jgi:hypothetical protein
MCTGFRESVFDACNYGIFIYEVEKLSRKKHTTYGVRLQNWFEAVLRAGRGSSGLSGRTSYRREVYRDKIFTSTSRMDALLKEQLADNQGHRNEL